MENIERIQYKFLCSVIESFLEDTYYIYRYRHIISKCFNVHNLNHRNIVKLKVHVVSIKVHSGPFMSIHVQSGPFMSLNSLF